MQKDKPLCEICADYDVISPATRIKAKMARLVAKKLDWTLEETRAAGYRDAMDVCEECYSEAGGR